jgi:hypothetical protein
MKNPMFLISRVWTRLPLLFLYLSCFYMYPILRFKRALSLRSKCTAKRGSVKSRLQK